jgi:actin-like ATPase involved in cell morphogenesis
MTYALGIDLGTTYTAAAVARDGRAEVAALGYRATSVPTVVFLADDGRFLVGDAAERRASQEPRRVAREFKRRVGDPTPLLLGGSPVAVDRCLAEVLRWVVSTVSANEGDPPAAVTVTHPANWGEFKRDVLVQALHMVDLPDARLLSEPVAAATWYGQAERLAPGRTVAVYDLGGGTFDTTVLRRRADGGFETLGRAEGIERLGGIDVDEAVFGYVLRAVGEDDTLTERSTEDPGLMTALSSLRRACVDAKEALSSETSVSIPVWLPGMQTEVLLHRSEMEELVGPLLRPTVEALARVVRSAGLTPDDLDAVLLVGGSSRIPLITRQVSAGLGRPIVVDAHPKHPVALGAALDADANRPSPPSPSGPAGPGAAAVAAAGMASTQVQPPQPPPEAWTGTSPAPTWPPADAPPSGGYGGYSSGQLPAQALGQGGPGGPRSGQGYPYYGAPPSGSVADRDRRRLMLVAAGVSAVVVLLVVMIAMRGGGGGDDDDATTASDGSPTTLRDNGEPSNQGTAATVTVPATTTTQPPTNLLTSDSSAVFEAYATIHDGPVMVDNIVLYAEGYSFIDVQVEGQAESVDEYQWEGGSLSGPEPQTDIDELGAEVFDLSEIDPSIIPTISAQTLDSCPGTDLELTHVIIERDIVFDDAGRVFLLVYASHPVRGGGGYMKYLTDGTLFENYCE